MKTVMIANDKTSGKVCQECGKTVDVPMALYFKDADFQLVQESKGLTAELENKILLQVCMNCDAKFRKEIGIAFMSSLIGMYEQAEQAMEAQMAESSPQESLIVSADGRPANSIEFPKIIVP
jgi:ribosomal protein L40E